MQILVSKDNQQTRLVGICYQTCPYFQTYGSQMRCNHKNAIKDGYICFNESRVDNCCKHGIPKECPIRLKQERQVNKNVD